MKITWAKNESCYLCSPNETDKKNRGDIKKEGNIDLA